MPSYKTITAFTGFFAALLLGPLQAEAVIVINELLANPGGFDTNNDGSADNVDDEFLELVNLDSAAVTLEGWSLSDAITTRHIFGSGDIISGFGFVSVFGLDASSGRLGLNNSGDTLTLWSADGVVVDIFAYSSSEAGISWSRNPDGTGSFAAHPGADLPRYSPGMTIDGREYLSNQQDPQPPPDQPGGPVVPEPSSGVLLSSGLIWLLSKRRKIAGFPAPI